MGLEKMMVSMEKVLQMAMFDIEKVLQILLLENQGVVLVIYSITMLINAVKR